MNKESNQLELKYEGGLLGGIARDMTFQNLSPEQKKEKGNEFYKQRDYLEAIRCYNSALGFDCVPAALLNLSQTYIMVEMYEEALSKVDEFLFFEKDNFKANFREARARAFLRDFDESLRILQNLKCQKPNEKQVKTEEIERVKSL